MDRSSEEIEKANRRLEWDGEFYRQVTGIAFSWTVITFGCTILFHGGWSSRYEVSQGISVAAFAGIIGAICRRSGYPDAVKSGPLRSRQLPVAELSVAVIWYLALRIPIHLSHSGATISWWQFPALVFYGSVAGLLIATVEGVVDFAICGILGLILGVLTSGLSFPLAFTIQLFAAFLAGIIWPKGPQGIFDAFPQTGIFASAWIYLGGNAPVTSDFVIYLTALFVNLTLFRAALSRAPLSQGRKAQCLLGVSTAIICISNLSKPLW